MAAKTEKTNGIEHKIGEVIDRGANEDGLAWEDIYTGGKVPVYRVREILVEEGDTAYDASQNPDGQTMNARLDQRLRLSAAIVTPVTSVDEIGKLGSIRLAALLRSYARLNILPAADDQGNA